MRPNQSIGGRITRLLHCSLPADGLSPALAGNEGPVSWKNREHMGTYALAIADGVLFACLPDEADVVQAITEATAANYGFGLTLSIVRRAVLTHTARPGDDVVWREGSDSELPDADGRRYRYVVRRTA